MASSIVIYRGDSFTGTMRLRTKDIVDKSKENTYVIPVGASIVIRFPGETSTVTLSTGSGEVSIVNADTGTISYVGDSTKSLLLNLGLKQAIDVVLTDTSTNPDTIITWEKKSVLDVLDRANP